MPNRAVNSPNAVYQIAPDVLELLRYYGTNRYDDLLNAYLRNRQTLSQKYAREREMAMIPLTLPDGSTIRLSAGAHSQLIKDIIDNLELDTFQVGRLVYVGDTWR